MKLVHILDCSNLIIIQHTLLNEFALYPAFSVKVQGGDYDTLILSVPKHSPAFEYSYESLICKTLDEFIEFLDYNNRIWKI